MSSIESWKDRMESPDIHNSSASLRKANWHENATLPWVVCWDHRLENSSPECEYPNPLNDLSHRIKYLIIWLKFKNKSKLNINLHQKTKLIILLNKLHE